MKKLFLIAILILGIAVIYSGELDDFRFALGLYSDQNYSLAKVELQKFLNQYPDSNFIENARFLLANIYLKERSYQQAKELFEQLHATTTDPVIRPDIVLGLAQTYFFTNQTDKSHSTFLRFTREFRQHRSIWKAHYFLGRIEYQRGNLQASLNHLNTAEQHSTDWQIKIAKVETELALGDNESVARLLDHYLSGETRNEYFYQMIVLYLNQMLKLGDYDTVIAYAYDYIPKSSQYHDDYLLVLGEAKYELGYYDSAIDRLTTIKRPIERAKYLIALCNMSMDNLSIAEHLFTELSNEAANLEIRTNSFFFLASLRGRENIENANTMLHQFIEQNPQHPFIGTAYYQIALNNFRRDHFNEAITGFQRAKELGIVPEFEERTLYLTAESNFQLRNNQLARDGFDEYLTKYPEGSFVDEALFKTGLFYYERNDYPRALVQFERLVNEHPDSTRLSMALFYQGEIFSESRQYDIAMNKYQAAMPGFDDRNLLWIRLAQVNFLQGNYDRALTNLSNVPDTPDFLYEKNIITGNIHFARGNYLSALRSFDNASSHSTTDKQWVDAVLRQARTLYQLKEYREATNLYRRLHDRAPDEQYILMAAAAAFTAEDYRGAIEQYQRYIDEYPYGRDFYQAKLHIADSYYNLKDYVTAADKYQELISPERERAILINSLNGLEWSALQSERVDFVALINESIRPDSPTDFVLLLYDRKIKYYYSQRQWNEVINTARFIEQLSPAAPNIYEYRRLMAIAHTNLNQFNDAERIFSALHREKTDPQVLYAWSRLDLAQQDSTSALQKLQQATQLTNESQIWLDILTLSVKLNDQQFRRDYDRYLSFARGAEREQAMLLFIEWNMQNNRYQEARQTIDTLLQSSFEPIKAKAQYYKGVHLYKTGNINEAIPELLRVRYLFPRIEDVRLEAEILAIQAYMEINDKDNAQKLFDAIRNSLDPEKREELRKLVEG
ncbi:MAG: tetratricopeptide repeat protein [Candidatus Cloacimonetes bacterium]|nr:tetratricopeptide repeat protein [Candidatus Cloacimonadota bacterium]